MTTYWRYSGSLALGLLVALALFWLMTGLVRQKAELGERRPPAAINFIRMPEPENEVQRRRRQPPEPPEMTNPLPESPPLDRPEPQAAPPPMPMPAMAAPDLQSSLAPGGIPVMAAPTGPVEYSQPLTPVSQVPPRYPRRAMLAGISGWVKLEFMINPDGSVGDIRILEAAPRRNIFDQEAIRALSRWRFRPQISDGQAVAARAAVTITFKLE